MSLASKVWDTGRRLLSIPRRLVTIPLAKRAFSSCGTDFYMGKGCDFQGIQNISVGDHVSLGPRALIWTTRARVRIGDWVMFGPDVSIVTGNHRTDVRGTPMMTLTDTDKRPEDDEDVVIEGDCWLGGVLHPQGGYGYDWLRRRGWGCGHDEHEAVRHIRRCACSSRRGQVSRRR